MAVFNSAVLTARGNELLVDAVAGDKIIFTRMVTGSGEYSEEEKARSVLERMTSLKSARQEFTFSAHKKVSGQCVLLTAVISNKELAGSYKITEIGIYGKRAGDAEDFLCSVAVTKSLEESDTFPPYNGLQECQIVQDYYITISPDAEVTVITQGACVLREEFEALKESKLDKDGDGSNLTVKFETATIGENITSGTKLSAIMGILSRVIASLKAGAFSTVVHDLSATEEGGVLDAREGKVLKDMIDTVKQAFQDGCRKIVDKLTALGFPPADPQGPDEISSAIDKMYTDRYGSGYRDGETDGINKVKANPSGYGINTGFKYSDAVSTGTYTGIRVNSWKDDNTGSSDEHKSQSMTHNIPLKKDGKKLYGIKLILSCSADTSCSSTAKFTVKTVEGAVLGTDDLHKGSDDTAESKPEFCDLLYTTFTTAADYVILEGSVSANSGKNNQIASAEIVSPEARYK